MPQDIWEFCCGILDDGEHILSSEEGGEWLIVVKNGFVVKVERVS